MVCSDERATRRASGGGGGRVKVATATATVLQAIDCGGATGDVSSGDGDSDYGQVKQKCLSVRRRL
jgi:hypothetical protein